MLREIKTIASATTVEAVNLPTDLRAWLQERATELGMGWVLAHTDSGVIWGSLRDGRLALSIDAFHRPGLVLNPERLQQARLFGPDSELLLWRGPRGAWQTTLRQDGSGTQSDYFDEDYMLWGTQAERPAQGGFCELREGSEGIIHTPPFNTPPSENQRFMLVMRHYLQADASGMVRIVAGRLLTLKEGKERNASA